MAFVRVLACFGIVFLSLLAGCSSSEALPDARAEVKPATKASEPEPIDPGGIHPDASGGLIRGGSGEVPIIPIRIAKPGEIAIPNDGGMWPWNLNPAPAVRQYLPVTIENAEGAVTGLAIRASVDRAAVSFRVNWKRPGDQELTRMLWCDTAAGKVLAEWDIKEGWVPLDLSPDGKQILVRKQGVGVRPDVLGVWTVAADKELKRKSWRPHTTPDIGLKLSLPSSSNVDMSRDILWAAWIKDRIVSSSVAGQIRIFNAETFEQIATLDATPGRPTLIPDGSKVLFLNDNAVALLDPSTGAVVGTRIIGKLPEPSALAASPNGKLLAIGGLERTIYLDLVTGDSWEAVYPERSNSPKTISESYGWAGARHLFADHFIFDLDSSIPIWDYAGVGQARCMGNQVWVVVKGSETDATLRPFTFPQLAVAKRVAEEFAKPELLTVRPGEEISIDVSALPAEKQPEVMSALTKRLLTIGYRPGLDCPTQVVATLDAPSQAKTNFPGYRPVEFTRQRARIQLVKEGKVLWQEAWSIDPPNFLTFPKSKSLEERIRETGFGGPNYQIYSNAPIPAMIRGAKAPSMPLGRSELTAEGILDKP